MIATDKQISKAERPGVIEQSALYTLDEIKRRTGFSTAALRTARREGLQFRYVGGRAFCYGEDLVNFIRARGKTSKA